MELERRDVVVVGGGLAGLVAAATAAGAGARVALVDGRSVGGRARSTLRDGYVLNEGPHALYRRGAALRILDELGVRPTGAPPGASGSRMVWDGEMVAMPASLGGLARSRVMSSASKVTLAAWWSRPDRLVERLDGRGGDLSVGEWLDERRARPDLRRFVLALLRLGTYAARPEDCAAGPMLRQFGLAGGGVLYVDGGWQSIVDRLAEAAVARGVTILEHEAVTGVQQDGSGWTITTSRRTLTSPAVVLAGGGPAVAAALLGSDPADWVERAGPAQRAAVLDIGGDAPEHPFVLSADEPLYCSLHAPVAALAPAGRSLTTVMRYLAADDPADSATNRAALERHAGLAGAPTGERRTLERFLAAPVVTWGAPVPGVERPTGLELADRGVTAAGDWIGDHLLADASVASGRAAGLAAAERAARVGAPA